MNAPPIVTTRGLTKRYGRTVALDAVDLDLGLGVTGLLGPNGAGKSTLIRLLTTAMLPDAGSVTVLGHHATGGADDRTAVRRALGYVPQEVAIPRSMTCASFVDYVAVLKEWTDAHARRAEVLRVLDLVGLGDRTSAKVRTLSGGQRRRLALAQAFLGSPSFLVLDEPTTGLDPEQRGGLRALVSQRASTAAVLVATHQTEDVAALCDRVVVLAGGRVRYEGTVADFVATCRDSVWLAGTAAPGAVQSWRTAGGDVRSIGGRPPVDARSAEPTVEDAYLLMLGATSRDGVVDGVSA